MRQEVRLEQLLSGSQFRPVDKTMLKIQNVKKSVAEYISGGRYTFCRISSIGKSQHKPIGYTVEFVSFSNPEDNANLKYYIMQNQLFSTIISENIRGYNLSRDKPNLTGKKVIELLKKDREFLRNKLYE